jgi:hypothetical protein
MSALATRVRTWLSDPNPILVKELRATFRTNLFVRFLYLATGVVALLALVVGSLAAADDTPPATVGQVLFQLYMGTSLLLIVLVAPGHASASITSEREQQTWESLELSGMSAARIVLGKMAASYASIALVLVASTPAIGVAFLFGGVSPWQVAVGFASLLVALAPATAFGVALSARLRSTRAAVVLATLLSVPIGIAAIVALTVLGDVAHSGWGLRTEGPFFYTEALITRGDELDTWLLVLGVPLYAVGMPVWFLLASAIAALRPTAEDRARPMKVWAVVMTLTTLPVLVGLTWLSDAARAGQQEIEALALGWLILLGYGLLFLDEPALPPRAYTRRRASFSALRRALSAFGPGASGGMRFSFALALLSAPAFVAASLTESALAGTMTWPMQQACLIFAGGACCVSALAASFGTLLRVVLGHGLAARAVTVAALVSSAVFPVLGLLLVDPDALSNLGTDMPLVLAFSAFYPVLETLRLVERGSVDGAGLALHFALYGGLAFAFAALAEAQIARLRRAADARHARLASLDAPRPDDADGAP